MPTVLPHYYSSLGPFRAAFAAGLPILTYHKLGPRPRGVRLPGLYLSAARFDHFFRGGCAQAGFTSVPLAPALQPPGSCPPIVLTFDDGIGNNSYGSDSAATRLSDDQFLVSERLGRTTPGNKPRARAPARLMDDVEVRGGSVPANGSDPHPHPSWLTRLPLAAAREQIASSRKDLEDRFGVAVEHFCYPYGDWNERVRDAVAEAGYTTACTVEPGVNRPDTSPWSLKRFTARYPSRSLRTLREWWRSLRAS
ncbi:MAG: polysaccharide deacetylase family protein [Verrucomicrobiales bacterium]|nr:polysaccharide deacetylase family protein [Verrucomicrobiales bacterium]